MKAYYALGLSLSLLLNTALVVNGQSEVTPVLPKEIEEYTLEFERIQSLDRLERNIEGLYRKGDRCRKETCVPRRYIGLVSAGEDGREAASCHTSRASGHLSQS